MANRKSVQPVVDARGRLLLERRGLARGLGDALGKDAYHFLRTASWTRITPTGSGFSSGCSWISKMIGGRRSY